MVPYTRLLQFNLLNNKQCDLNNHYRFTFNGNGNCSYKYTYAAVPKSPFNFIWVGNNPRSTMPHELKSSG